MLLLVQNYDFKKEDLRTKVLTRIAICLALETKLVVGEEGERDPVEYSEQNKSLCRLCERHSIDLH